MNGNLIFQTSNCSFDEAEILSQPTVLRGLAPLGDLPSPSTWSSTMACLPSMVCLHTPSYCHHKFIAPVRSFDKAWRWLGRFGAGICSNLHASLLQRGFPLGCWQLKRQTGGSYWHIATPSKRPISTHMPHVQDTYPTLPCPVEPKSAFSEKRYASRFEADSVSRS